MYNGVGGSCLTFGPVLLLLAAKRGNPCCSPCLSLMAFTRLRDYCRPGPTVFVMTALEPGFADLGFTIDFLEYWAAAALKQTS